MKPCDNRSETVPHEVRRGGFALAELLVAIFIGAALLVTLASINASVVHKQMHMLGRSRLNSMAVYALESIRTSASMASYVIKPAAGAPANEFSGYINVSPVDLSSPIIPSEARKYFYYCLTSNPDTLYRYSGNVPMPPVSCGAAPASGKRETIAGSSSGQLQISFVFSREPNVSNVVKLQYRLHSLPSASGQEVTIKGDTAVQIQGALN